MRFGCLPEKDCCLDCAEHSLMIFGVRELTWYWYNWRLQFSTCGQSTTYGRRGKQPKFSDMDAPDVDLRFARHIRYLLSVLNARLIMH